MPWPWYCSDLTFTAIGYLAFPVNLLTNDLSQAVRLAPLALVSYAILGALIGLGLERMRPSGVGRRTGGRRDVIDREPARKRGRGEGGVQDDPARRGTRG